MAIFDYIYFRIAKFFYKKDGSLAPRAIGIITIIEMLVFGNITTLIVRHLIPLQKTAPHSKTIGLAGGVLALLLMTNANIGYKI